MEQFLQAETVIIELLLVVTLVALAVRRLRIPYTVALVLVGLAITFQRPIEIDLTPELILTLFVPPLVFEAAFHLNFRELRRDLSTILLLTIPGVVVTTLIVGLLIAWLTPLGLPIALVFGALIAATDPVAVVALFRSLGVPRRLSVLIESESLLNDGTAIVIFNLVLGIALTGKFDIILGTVDFVRVAAGGTLVGFALGWMTSRIIARVDDYLIETTLTTVLAFGSYLLAERLHFSGVLAVVAAGLVNGNIGPQGMSPTTRIVLFNFWEYVAFLANSLLFLLIGLQVDLPRLMGEWQPIAIAILVVLFGRVVIIHGLSRLINRVAEPLPNNWLHILSWGGLRGAISFALVLSLPGALGEERDLIRLMAFGVVLFTLLVQAPTMGVLIRRLRLNARSDARLEYELRHARFTALRAGQEHLDQLHKNGLISNHTWDPLRKELADRAGVLADAVRHVMTNSPEIEAEEMDTAHREIFRAQRSAISGLRRDGVISDEAFEKLIAEVDAALESTGASLDEAEPVVSGERAI